MNKKQIGLFIALFFLFSCKQVTEQTNRMKSKDIISVTILPQKYFVEQIADTLFDVNVMIPPGSNPATYEPSPRQMKDVNSSKIYFISGHLNFEENWVEKILKSNPDITSFNTSEGIDFFEADDGHHHHGHSHIVDPHIWMSPSRVKTIAENIFHALDSLYPEYHAVFEQNYSRFISLTDSIDAVIRTNFENIPNNHFIIYHPALTYFAHDYGLVQHTLELGGKSPSATYLKQVVDLAKSNRVDKILIQSQFDQSNAELIAKETGAQLIVIDPLAYNWEEELIEISKKLGN